MENDYVPPTTQEFESVLLNNGFRRSVLESHVFKNSDRKLRVIIMRDEHGLMAHIPIYDYWLSSPKSLQGKLNNIFVEDVLSA